MSNIKTLQHLSEEKKVGLSLYIISMMIKAVQ